MNRLIPYYRARYYVPTMGRFISRDTLPKAELSQGPNLYWYVRDNAVNRVDPSGLKNCCPTDLSNAQSAYQKCISDATKEYADKVAKYAASLQKQLTDLDTGREAEENAVILPAYNLAISLANKISDPGLRQDAINAADQSKEALEGAADDAEGAAKATDRAANTALNTAAKAYEIGRFHACCTQAKALCSNFSC